MKKTPSTDKKHSPTPIPKKRKPSDNKPTHKISPSAHSIATLALFKKGLILFIGFSSVGILLAVLVWLLITVEFSIQFNDSNTIARRAFELIEWLTGHPAPPANAP